VGYDSDKADDAVWFFENRLTHTKGKYAKKEFKLAKWQDKIIRELFGTIKVDGARQYSTAYVEIPKKNGKSELAAGIALYCLLMDGEEGAEVYSAAATREQAAIVFRVAAQMVRNNAKLNEECRIIDSTKTILIRDDPNCFYKAISADAGTQDGINPSCVVFDELHRQKTRDLWDVLTYGSDTRRQPLTFAITTAGIIGESPVCEQQHSYAESILKGVFKDPTFYPVIYGLDEKEDWTLESNWYKANPALDDFLPVDKVRTACEKAKRLPAEQNSFRRLRLDQWTSQETRWIPLAEWEECGGPFNPNDLVGKDCIAGLDLSTTKDITALALLFPVEDEIFVIPHFWLPEHDLYERSVRDSVPYDFWVKQELIHTTPGNIIDYSFIRKKVNELADVYSIQEIAHDPWNATQIALELAGDGFTMVPIRQGFISLSAPSKELERLVMGRKLHHGGHPVLRWMLDCTSILQDSTGNIKPVKPDRGKSSKRIDGIVATVIGLARVIARDNRTSVYEDHGIIEIG
jgi:phage terminase large subunit-like protein